MCASTLKMLDWKPRLKQRKQTVFLAENPSYPKSIKTVFLNNYSATFKCVT